MCCTAHGGAIVSLVAGWRRELYTRTAMDQLLAMGFPEENAKAALEAHGNDLARSLDALLSTAEPASTPSSSATEVKVGPQESA